MTLDTTGQSKTDFRKRYQLLWRGGFSNGKQTIVPLAVGTKYLQKTGNKYLADAPTSSGGYETSIIRYFLDKGLTNDILLTLNTPISMVQEYTPQTNNIIATTNTLGGPSISAFGQGVKKIDMRISVVKPNANSLWMYYTSALEAMSVMSVTPKYYGNLYLMAFDQDRATFPRKYKVVVETINPSYRAEKSTIIDVSMTFVVKYDFSLSRSMGGSGVWGSI